MPYIITFPQGPTTKASNSLEFPWSKRNLIVFMWMRKAFFQIPFTLDKNNSFFKINSVNVLQEISKHHFHYHSYISHILYSFKQTHSHWYEVRYSQSGTSNTLYLALVPNSYLMSPSKMQYLAMSLFGCSHPCNGWTGQGLVEVIYHCKCIQSGLS